MNCVDLVLYDEEFARRQQLADILDRLRSVWDDIKAAFDGLAQVVKQVVRMVIDLWDEIRACIVPPRVLYLSKHGRTARVRKKNLARIERLWRKLLKGGSD